MHHPWGDLRRRPHINLTWTPLPEQLAAVTDGRERIWMDTTLSQVERRCAICHELAHIDLGHACGDDPALELAASKLAARRLIWITDLESVFGWSLQPAEQADILWVTEAVLQVRLEHLHPAERGLLRRAVEHHRESEQQWDRFFNDEMGIA